MLKIGDKVRVVSADEGTYLPKRYIGLVGEVQENQRHENAMFNVFFPEGVRHTGLKDQEDDGVWPMYAHELEVIV